MVYIIVLTDALRDQGDFVQDKMTVFRARIFLLPDCGVLFPQQWGEWEAEDEPKYI